MDTQVHNTWLLTCAQHKNFVNMSENKQNQVTIYIRKQYKSYINHDFQNFSWRRQQRGCTQYDKAGYFQTVTTRFSNVFNSRPVLQNYLV